MPVRNILWLQFSSAEVMESVVGVFWQTQNGIEPKPP